MQLGGALFEQRFNLFTGNLHGSAIWRVERIAEWRDLAFMDELIELRAPNAECLKRFFDGHVFSLTHTPEFTTNGAGFALVAHNAYNKCITNKTNKRKLRMPGQWGNAKPIETVYQGCKFRSRLEARWAVFFDAMGVVWQYELEGFDLDGIRYLPDFWLPEVSLRNWPPGLWVEVKPAELSTEEYEKANRLCALSRKPVAVVVGAPGGQEPRVPFDGNYQFAPMESEPPVWWDNYMFFMQCHDCGYIKYEFLESNYMECPKCGATADERSSQLVAAYQSAKSARFERRKR